jgi:DNA-binding transcriptional regulator GbsR (MarR family)
MHCHEKYVQEELNVDPALRGFIETWGTMGSLWGINRSTARLHALLLASDEPLHLDQIAERLAISKGNASMSLKELCAWGLVERKNLHGDRRDYFTVEPDVWLTFFKIAKERKKREFDPALVGIRKALQSGDGGLSSEARKRLSEMEQLLETAERLLSIALADPAKGKHLFSFFSELLQKGA